MGGYMPPEYYAAYGVEYKKRPGVRERLAAKARLRSKLPSEQPKIAARKAAREAVRRGLLIKCPCEKCGSLETEAHHDDYSKPLSVRWLCRAHHSDEHKRPRKMGPGHPPLVTHCYRGHPYDAANTYVSPAGRRNCRACNALAQKRRKAKATQP